jgi:hypothetical protein
LHRHVAGLGAGAQQQAVRVGQQIARGGERHLGLRIAIVDRRACRIPLHADEEAQPIDLGRDAVGPGDLQNDSGLAAATGGAQYGQGTCEID